MSVVELKFYAWNAPNGTLLGTLTDADLESFEIRPEHRGAGSGVFSISRTNTNATTALLGFGHNSLAGPRLVKVHYPWMPAPYDTEPAWAFWLWEGDFSLLNQDGDDTLTFSGPGVRGIWSEYVLYHSSTTDDQPARGSADHDDMWWWENEPYGAIATRVFEEGRHAPYPGAADANSTFQFVTIDFNRTTDSDGATWSNVAEEYQQGIGTDAGTVLADLEEAGDFTLVGTPDLLFSAYEAYGDDLTGTAYGAGVVRVQGDTGTEADNILSDLSRHAILNQQRTHLLGRDSDSSYFTEIHPSYSSGPERWRSVAFDETNDDTLLNAKAAQIFVEEGHAQNQIQVEVKPGNSVSTGRYLPFVHYKPGDTITVDTGSAEHDYTNEDALLSAFRVVLAEASRDDTDDDAARSLHVILELNTARTGGGIPSASGGTGGIGCRCPELCRPSTAGSCTRLYLSTNDSTLTADPAVDAAWEAGGTPGINRLKTTADGTATTTSSTSGGTTGGRDVIYGRWAIELTSGLAAIIAAGGATLRGQFQAHAREGIGIDESDQFMLAQVNARVTTGNSTTIRGTALPLHSLASVSGGQRWAQSANFHNRMFPPTDASNVLSAVSGAAAGDFLIVEIGSRNFTIDSEDSGGTLRFFADGASDLPEQDSLVAEMGPDFNSWIDICTGSTPGDTPQPLAGEGDVGTSHRVARCDHAHAHGDLSESGTHNHSTDQIEGWSEIEGDFVTTSFGGGEDRNVVGATGATETIDLSSGNHQDFTLDTDCTFTMPAVGEGLSFTAFVRQDGTGSHTPTFTSVVWPGGVTPTFDETASTLTIVTFVSDGTSWYGFVAGSGSGGSVGDLNDLTDVTITAPAEGDLLRYDGSVWVNATPAAMGLVGAILMTDGITNPPEPLWTDDGTDYLYADL